MVERTKIFFNHIPKTAGTTVSAYLDNFYTPDEIWPHLLSRHVKAAMNLADKEDIERIPPIDEHVTQMLDRALEKSKDHATLPVCFDELVKELRLIHIHWNIRDVLPDDWRIITFLRDPQARLLSLYNDWRSVSDETINRIPRSDAWRALRRRIRELSLPDVLRMDHEAVRTHYWNGMARALAGHVPLGDVWNDPIHMTDDELLETACRNLDTMFFVGIVEQFQQTMMLLQSRMGWPYNPAPSALNVRPDYRHDLSFREEDCRLIEQAVAVDREVYAYGKRLFNEASQAMQQEAGDAEPGEWVEQRYRRQVNRFIAERDTAADDAVSITMDAPLFGNGWKPRERLSENRYVRYTAAPCHATIDHVMADHRADRYTVTLYALSGIKFAPFDPTRSRKIRSLCMIAIYRTVTAALPVWSVLGRLQLTMNGVPGRMIRVERGKEGRGVRFSFDHVPLEEDGFIRLAITVSAPPLMNRLLPERYVSVGLCRIEIE